MHCYDTPEVHSAAVLRGQHQMDEAEAAAVGKMLDLPEDAVMLLATAPYKAGLHSHGVPLSHSIPACDAPNHRGQGRKPGAYVYTWKRLSLLHAMHWCVPVHYD